MPGALQRPMLGAQRRVEARIGELLGEARVGVPNPHHDEVSHDQTRADFRLLARGFASLVEARRSVRTWFRSCRSILRG